MNIDELRRRAREMADAPVPKDDGGALRWLTDRVDAEQAMIAAEWEIIAWGMAAEAIATARGLPGRMTTMPNGPAFNGPTCPVCGLYASVHGCTAERCANPAAPVTITIPYRAPTAMTIVRTHADGEQSVTTFPLTTAVAAERTAMSGAKTSPGPWKWDDENRLLDVNGAPVVHIDVSQAWEAGDSGTLTFASYADARLITVAPTMLALLREAEWTRTRGRESCPWCANDRDEGHALDCEAAVLLAELDE